MREEIKQRWVTALRSGKYKQTSGFLRTVDGYCCLGVLCDLHNHNGMNWKGGPDEDRMTWSYYTEEGTLPKEVMDWAQLTNHNPEIKGDALAEINDSGRSFAEIADLIELNF